MSTSLESPLPSHYRSKQEFLTCLPPWRRLLAKLNWHPTIEKKVVSYASEQRAKQLRSENERLKKEDEHLAELDARIAALWPSSNANATPDPPIDSSSIP
ncbi:MAG: hypothetical protein ACK522_14375 [Synechococcaceae cyanobacterium]|jgi:hypothetical protein